MLSLFFPLSSVSSSNILGGLGKNLPGMLLQSWSDVVGNVEHVLTCVGVSNGNFHPLQVKDLMAIILTQGTWLFYILHFMVLLSHFFSPPPLKKIRDKCCSPAGGNNTSTKQTMPTENIDQGDSLHEPKIRILSD